MIGNFKHQLCRGTVKHIEKGGKWLGQPKLDGMRVGIFKKGGQLNVFSRNLKPQPFVENYSWIANGLEAAGIDLSKYLVDGEVTAGTRFEAIGLSHRQYALSHEEREVLKLRPFDILPIADIMTDNLTYTGNTEDRIDFLNQQLFGLQCPQIEVVDTQAIADKAHAERYYEELLKQGHEGAVFKLATAPYKFGNSQYWVKMKADFDEDLIVTDAIEGVGKFAGTLGAFVVDRQGVSVHVGSFQIDDAERAKLWEQRSDLIGKTIEVRHFGATPAGSLSHPIFVCVRWDR